LHFLQKETLEELWLLPETIFNRKISDHMPPHAADPMRLTDTMGGIHKQVQDTHRTYIMEWHERSTRSRRPSNGVKRGREMSSSVTGKPAYRMKGAMFGLTGMLALAVSVAVSAGCNEQIHRQQVAQRRQSLERTVRRIEDSEARRPDKLERTVAHIADWHERDLQKTGQMPDTIGRAIEEDFQRWERAKPAHQRRAHDLIKAKPESFERTTARMFN
jgi:hypothetical protein